MPAPFSDATVAGSVRYRTAGADDAAQIAELHADSWRRHYRGAYADSFLDGDVVADRRAVWSTRLAAPANSETVLAERDDLLVGFVHIMFDVDPRWGSLVDNLHVLSDQRRTGIGTHLLAAAARAAAERANANGMYLWVLQQNAAAQKFYYRNGAILVESAPVPAPGGDPTRLNGSPFGLRLVWRDASQLS